MSGTIIKIGKVITKTAEKIMLNATNGDINFNAAKSVVVSSDKEITYSSYEAVTPDAQEDLLVKKVKGPKEVTVGKEYTFTAAVFSRKATPVELQSVKWAYKIDDGAIQHFKNPGTVIGGVVTKKIYIDEELWDNKTLKVYAYFQNPSDSVSVVCDIKLFEKIFVVGTEQHSATYGNKMMFPAQAIREVKENSKTKDLLSILIFTDGYNSEELNVVEKSGKNLFDNLNFIKINSVKELVNYINKGNDKVSRENVKISEIKIFSHGLASVLDFGLDGVNRQSQQFGISHASQLKKEVFTEKAKLYSYACRTGNSDRRLIVSVNSAYKYDDNWLELVKPEESLAQKLADHLNVTVYAYLKRSLYTATWNDKGDKEYQKDYKEIEDESINGWKSPKKWVVDWDEALWHSKGAFAPPTIGSTPYGLPSNMYVFKKGIKPSEK
ncbi:hypothetical protein G1K97_13035 [Tenacibaculum finnmarkense]|uniref:hypothetical protein n=1 Tax=Tenacibaculum finnmarkense TaxID=2781243 RepID=UPI001EFBF74D|nr:hypothetical protein [Tenacibaculum finnmarkense]MCG8894616.1 hypothetical protein [Tenacibaculum finnmarkense]MCG8902756.1 hypothetical protein [Tenacibaculum finnmarkense]